MTTGIKNQEPVQAYCSDKSPAGLTGGQEGPQWAVRKPGETFLSPPEVTDHVADLGPSFLPVKHDEWPCADTKAGLLQAQ